MSRSIKFAFLCLTMFVCSCSNSTVWNMDSLNFIGGHKTTVVGTPKVIETEKGKAVEFDGIKDGLVVEAIPLAGAEKFTMEVIFRPDVNGPASQRLIYMQENGSKNRITMAVETAPADKNLWCLDTFIKCATGSKNLYKTDKTRATGQWYNAALIYDGQKMSHYLNGIEEASEKFLLTPLNDGKTSIGTKIDQSFWFKGAIRKIRFTRSVLPPQEFLKP